MTGWMEVGAGISKDNNMEVATDIYCTHCDRFSKPRVFFDDLCDESAPLAASVVGQLSHAHIRRPYNLHIK